MARVVPVAFVFFLCGCASALYDWNIQHAEISTEARLTHAEVDQIIRTVTQKSLSTILCITRRIGGHGDDIVVYTLLQRDPDRFMAYHLEKDAGGVWQIISYGVGSIIVC